MTYIGPMSLAVRQRSRDRPFRRLASLFSFTSFCLVVFACALVVGGFALFAAASPRGAAPRSRDLASELGAFGTRTKGLHWRRIVTHSAPSPRVTAPLAYDPTTRQLVLVGGTRQVQATTGSRVESTTILDDTWVFAHKDWRQVKAGPTPPASTRPGAVAYDPARKTVVLVTAPASSDGMGTDSSKATTWTWTRTHWAELRTKGPVWGNWPALMVYDTETHQLVLVLRPSGPAGDSGTYVLSRAGWRAESAPPRLGYMAYDPMTRRLVGQSAGSGWMWWWTGQRWRVLKRRVVVHLNSGSAYGMFDEAANWVTDSATGELIAFGFTVNTTASTVHTGHSPYLFAFVRGGWHPIKAAIRPPPVNPQFFSLADDSSVVGVVAFGGGGEQSASGGLVLGGNGTWELVGAG